MIAAGNLPKLIDETVGRVNTGHHNLSVAHMRSPQGWEEPGQTPNLSELTYVLKGEVLVETASGKQSLQIGQAFISLPNQWVRYSTP